MSELRELLDFLEVRLNNERAMIEGTVGTPPRTGWQLWTTVKETTPGGEEIGPRGSIEMSVSRALAEVEFKRKLIQLAAVQASEMDKEWGDAHEPEEILAGECSDRGAPQLMIELLEPMAAIYGREGKHETA